MPGDPNYALALLDGEPVAGMVHKAQPTGLSKQPAWLTFMAVRDVDAAQQAACSRAARCCRKRTTYPHRGRQAVLADADGAVFAVLAAEGGDPPDYLATPGEWIWSAVLVRDPKRETNSTRVCSATTFTTWRRGWRRDAMRSTTFFRATITPAPGSTACPQIPCVVTPLAEFRARHGCGGRGQERLSSWAAACWSSREWIAKAGPWPY